MGVLYVQCVLVFKLFCVCTNDNLVHILYMRVYICTYYVCAQVVEKYNKHEKQRQELIRGVHVCVYVCVRVCVCVCGHACVYVCVYMCVLIFLDELIESFSLLEFVHTEKTHLKKLKVMLYVSYCMYVRK